MLLSFKKIEFQKQFSEQVNQEEQIKKQYDKYQIIKNKAERTMISKLKQLKELRSYENMFSLKYEIILNKKRKIYQELKDKVNSIKDESEDLFVQLESMKNQQKMNQELIKDFKYKIGKYTVEISNTRKENMYISILIEKIYQILNVNNLKEVIEICNKRKYLSETLNKQFQSLNKDLNFLSSQLSDYLREIRDIEKYIKEKNRSTETEDPNEEVRSPVFDSQLESIRKDNLQIYKKIKFLEELLNKICRNMLIHNEKLGSVIPYFHKLAVKKFVLKKKDLIKTIILSEEDEPFGSLEKSSIFQLDSNLSLKDVNRRLTYNDSLSRRDNDISNDNNILQQTRQNSLIYNNEKFLTSFKQEKSKVKCFEYIDNKSSNIDSSILYIFKTIIFTFKRLPTNQGLISLR